MSERHVVAFVGLPGAGKSECVKHTEALGVPSVYFGGLIIDEVKARGLEVNEENEKHVREDIRAKEGKGAYAERIIIKIETLFDEGENRVVADGLYSWTEYKIFKKHFGNNVTIIAVAAPREQRHQWLAQRPLRPLTDEEATSREYAEIENLEKGGPIANADFTVLNNGTKEQLIEQVDTIFEQVGFVD